MEGKSAQVENDTTHKRPTKETQPSDNSTESGASRPPSNIDSTTQLDGPSVRKRDSDLSLESVSSRGSGSSGSSQSEFSHLRNKMFSTVAIMMYWDMDYPQDFYEHLTKYESFKRNLESLSNDELNLLKVSMDKWGKVSIHSKSVRISESR